ncbi:MAG: TonB-dependent receptor [Prevotellaceae bacterium]|jgi:iron complex outermembrane receptor protein|nr:TonB-dependent receptor [Prevotellaceae bacterium]
MKREITSLCCTFVAATATLVAQPADTAKQHDIQEVVVTATRADARTPMAYSNVNREEIEQSNFGQDIPLLLALTPSVIATSDAGTGIGYTGFRVRGTDANRVNVTVNGIPLNEAESHGVFWVNMPDFASSLQDMQIQRGVGTSTNGAAAFGASVNMRTEKIPTKAYGELSSSYGSFSSAKATLKLGSGLVKEHWAFDARLSSISSDGFIDRASVDLQSYFAQGAYINGKTVLKLVTFGGSEKTYHAWDGVPGDILATGNRTYNPSGYMGTDANGNPLYYDNQTDNYRQTHYQLSLMQELTQDLKLNAALHYTKGKGYYEEYKGDATLAAYGLGALIAGADTITESDLVRQKHLDNDFYGGVFSFDYKKEKLTASLGGGANYYNGKHFGYATWVKNYALNENFAPNHEFYRSTGKKLDGNLYLKVNYEIVSRLNLYGDVQYRYIDYRIKGLNDVWDWSTGEMQPLDIAQEFNFFNPKAGALYSIGEHSKVFASVAVAHREPNRNNYTDAQVNEMPNPERLIDYELGYKFSSGPLSAGANLYYMQYKDQLVLTGKVNDIGEPLTSNVPRSYRTGVELTLGAKLAPWLQWNGNLSLSKNEIEDYTEHVLVDDGASPQKEEYYGATPIAYSPAVVAGSLFSFSHKGFGAGLQSSYVGKQYLDNTGSANRSIDPYFVNNLTLGYTFRPTFLEEISLHLQVNNIFNHQYETNGWVWAAYYTNAEGGLDPYVEKSYFPQAGTNFMVRVEVKF